MGNISQSGRIKVENGVRVLVGGDICKYYRKLFEYHVYWTKSIQQNTYGAHISIILPDIHNIVDLSSVAHYDNRIVEFTYSPEDLFISPKNVWLNVNLPVGKGIKDTLGIKEKDFWGYHLTIGNFKQENGNNFTRDFK